MLIVISDIHLGDGTCGTSISKDAFRFFANRVKELALHASWRTNGRYQPVETIDIVLMGDILDPVHSTLWLDEKPSEAGYTRPWTNSTQPQYAEKLSQITRAILSYNVDGIATLKNISKGNAISLPPANANGQPDQNAKEQSFPLVRLYYMVGNHDWYYHLPGKAFDDIRQEIISAMGLVNSPAPFPHQMEESAQLMDLLHGYKAYLRHGDIYDSFNYNKDSGRNTSALGDMFAVEMINRFPLEAQSQLGINLPPVLVDNLRQLINVRPALATPLWISGQIHNHAGSRSLEDKLKSIWDTLGREFLSLGAVRALDKSYEFDMVDTLQLALGISEHASFTTIKEIVTLLNKKMWGGNRSFAKHALKESAFKELKARSIVFGHTHHHEIIPLDFVDNTNQIYFNSGTWRTYYDLATYKPQEQEFISYEVLTYLTFYRDGERGGRHFETWTGASA